MSTGFDVRALDTRIRIEFDETVDPRERERIRSQWADLIDEASSGPDFTIRAAVAEGRAPTGTLDSVEVIVDSEELLADQLASRITFTAATRLRGDAIMLHAAGVALPDGRVIGLVGPSGRGKTTASRAFSGALDYVTDETLAVRLDGSVVAYPKPLSLGVRPAPKRPAAATALGLRAAAGDLQLAALVLLDRRPNVEKPYLQAVPLAEAITELVQQASYLKELDQPLLAVARTILATGGVRRVVYAEAESLPQMVEELLTPLVVERPQLTWVDVDAMADCDCIVEKVPGSPVPSDVPYNEAPTGTYRRAVYDDALLVDESLLVLANHRIVVLDGIGPAVWLAADDSSNEELCSAVLSQFPAPPPGVDPADVVGGVIRGLVSAGLLLRH